MAKEFEEVIQTVKPFGLYQKLAFIVVFMIGGATAFFQLGNTFHSASDDHYCRVYKDQTFAEYSPVKNCTIPYNLDGDDINWSKCKRYDVNITREEDVSAEVCLPRGSHDTMGCDDGWVYDKTWYENTVVFEYDLVCENDWMKQLSKSIVPLGNLIGVLIFGQIADIIGRKPVYVITLIISVAVAIATSFAPSYPLFIIGQFCLGAFPHSYFVTTQVMVMEIVGLEYRTMCGTLPHLAFSIFYMLLGAIALLCGGDWRLTHLVLGCIWVLFLPSIFFITETPMWLMHKHKYDKCTKVLQKFARYNKTTFPDDYFDEEKKLQLKAKDEDIPKEKSPTLLDLFKTPRMRLRTLIMCLNWFSCSFVYFGISLNTDQLGQNPYNTFILAGFVEVPGCLMAWWFMNLFGRRWSLCGFSVVGGICLTASISPQIPELAVAIALVAKLCIAAVFTIVYVYGIEIFPTVARNAGMGVSSMSARVGSIISPYVILLDVYWGPLPFVIMGGTSVLAGLTALILPETKNIKLPETILEGEMFGTKQYDEEQEKIKAKKEESEMTSVSQQVADEESGMSHTNQAFDKNEAL